jgi:hypothetical protein
MYINIKLSAISQQIKVMSIYFFISGCIFLKIANFYTFVYVENILKIMKLDLATTYVTYIEFQKNCASL